MPRTERRRGLRRWAGVLAGGGLVCSIVVARYSDGATSVASEERRVLPATVPVPQDLPTGWSTARRSLPEASRVVHVTPVRASPVREHAPIEATFAFTGDTLVHSPLVRQAMTNAGGQGFDFAPMFARVAPILSAADAAICHLETPIAPAGEDLTTYPAYGVPAEISVALASAGYDRCSTASNHSLDRGAAGIDATVAALESAGLTEAGMARTETEAAGTLIEVNGIVVAHLSYTFGLNGIVRPTDEPWRTNLIDDGHIVDDARHARALGADVVVVSLHWGSEGSSTPNAYQRDVANWITASGEIDLVIGHHAHVLQPIEQVNGTWVVFGLGNFLSNMPTGDAWPASTQDGAIVEVTFSLQGDGSVGVSRPVVIPTWVDRANGWVIRSVVADLADPTVTDSMKTRLQQSLDRTAAVLGEFIAP